MTTDNPSLEPVEVMLRERAKAQPLLVALQRAIAVVDPAMAAMFDTGEPDPRMGKLLDALDIEYAALTRPEAQSLPTVSEGLAAVHVVFDGPPSHESGRFVECEAPDGRSINIGEWYERKSGFWELRIPLRAQPSNEAEGWRDIASAPKDGTPVILAASHGVSVGWWENSEPTFKWRFVDDFDLTPTGCCDRESDDRVPCNGMHADAPTHWRPLPAAPTALNPEGTDHAN